MFEAASVTQRSEEPLPDGRLSATHYLAVHRHLFQDVYPWAGRIRTVRMLKEQSAFCYPENIWRELGERFSWLRDKRFLVGLSADEFASGSATFLAEINAIHPFRDGNGRSMNAFFALLAARAGHPLNFARMDAEAFLSAMVQSFFGKSEPLRQQVRTLIDDA